MCRIHLRRWSSRPGLRLVFLFRTFIDPMLTYTLGTCWMKNSRGSATSAGGNNYVAGFLKQSTSSSASSASSSSTSSSSASSTTVSSSAAASSSSAASLCPQANGQIITDANGKTYNVTCSSDSSVGSYTNAQASSSYLDCMTACDAASSSGCQGFTYVGGANGAGSGWSFLIRTQTLEY